MSFFEIWLTLIGISMSLSALPQIYVMYRDKSSQNESVLMWAIFAHAVFWWMMYGIVISSAPLIITNLWCFIIDLFGIFTILKYGKEENLDVNFRFYKFINYIKSLKT